MTHPADQSHPALPRTPSHVRSSLLTSLVALVVLLSLPVGAAAQSRGGACNDATIGQVVFAFPPAGEPAELLSFKMSSSKNRDGSIAPGPLSLCKPTDSNTPALLLAAAGGNPVASVRLEIRQPNPRTASMVIVLQDAFVSSVAWAQGSIRPLEEVELVSCSVQITVIPEEGPPSEFSQRCGASPAEVKSR